jgi:hypothetical protein
MSDTVSSIRRAALQEGFGLKLAVAFGIMTIIITLVHLGRPARQRVLEATSSMERLARSLSQAEQIAPDTVVAVEKMMRQATYDCEQVGCDVALAIRNRLARTELQTVLLKGRVRVRPPTGPESASQVTH